MRSERIVARGAGIAARNVVKIDARIARISARSLLRSATQRTLAAPPSLRPK